ncbi:zinc finger protein NUTCRACKER-like [Diospyros lotus]|uniref:zinc finger protein NUTCRACKER-like n=1 Tax=Diospyros lotus TaxID=55363 RepID=UPI002253B488|nr:zinc finger protein NUTCRACKER-like [Diospyros lotus]XP_052206636.1 zinc finger protein NUTCRACKER-like [Diospyros lotus]
MLEEMEDEAIPNSFGQNPACGSNPPPPKKKRNLPGNPDPEAEVIALSPRTLMATNRFLCEICGKGFQRDQNLQLHRRGHNLPWKLKQRSSKEVRKRVYVCPERTCVHHHPSRALGDLTGIKKHFCRKHGERKWKCDKCSKRYAVQSDWKAHSKTCGTREYRCDCGTIFSRRDSFITHRAFCDALAEETARISAAASSISNATMVNNIAYHIIGAPISPGAAQQLSSTFKPIPEFHHQEGIIMGNHHVQDQIHHPGSMNSASAYGDPIVSSSNPPPADYQLNWVFGNKLSSNISIIDQELITSNSLPLSNAKEPSQVGSLYSSENKSYQTPYAHMSATALLQKAAQIGATSTDPSLFLGSLGFKCSTNKKPQEENNKLCGLFVEGLEDDFSSFQQLQSYPSKRRNTQNSEDSATSGGQTRDFLGVGVHTLCQPSSVNGWL